MPNQNANPWLQMLMQNGGNGQNPLAQMYSSNNDLAGTIYGSNASMQNANTNANAGMANTYTSSLADLLGTQYGANTQFNIADLQNAGQNWRTAAELKNALELAGVNNKTAEAIANTQAGAQRYGADQNLAGTKVGAEASKYGSLADMLQGMFGSQKAAESSQYGSLAGLLGTRYTNDTNAQLGGMNNASQLAQTNLQANAAMAPSQAKIYTFNQMLPLIKGILQRKGLA